MQEAFMEHVATFGLSYGTVEEFNFRAGQFASVHETIEEINAANIEAGISHRVGHNFLSSWTAAEKKKLNGYKDHGVLTDKYTTISGSTPAAEVNWVTAGAVTDPKDQGQCGSCWSFSTTGAFEGAYALNVGALTRFSEQQLVSCDHIGNAGCNGGSMSLALWWLEQHSSATEADYPYTSGHGQQAACLDTTGMNTPAHVVKVNKIPADSLTLMVAAAAKQPISIAVQADQPAFQQYTTGVVQKDCGTSLDHGVLIAGYGTEDNVDYWLVKNSWGAAWGDHGYLKIMRSEGTGVCGINMQAVYPDVAATV